MPEQVNQQIYNLWAATFYDPLFGFIFHRTRQRVFKLLALRSDERIFIPGIGTGLDLKYLQSDSSLIGLDFNLAMLQSAKSKINQRRISLLQGDAQQLPFSDHTFDVVVCNLILSVVPDGKAAFHEIWRILRPSGRCIIMDKFLPENHQISPLRQAIGYVFRMLGTDPNRRLHDILEDCPDLVIRHQEASLLGGFYQIVLLEKARE